MKHVKQIQELVQLVCASRQAHALVIKGPTGWAKSATIDRALEGISMPVATLGSYSTPLHLYNFLADYSERLVIADDCAGIFGNPVGMSILKAATWSSAGGSGVRRVMWGSTSAKVQVSAFDFTGKLVLLTNSFPKGIEQEAFQSRTFFYEMDFDLEDVKELLRDAAKSKDHFPNQDIAENVVDHLVQNIERFDWRQINLRSLAKIYELAVLCPDSWKDLAEQITPRVPPLELVQQLSNENRTVAEQEREFVRVTGKSRRTFWNYRKQLGLSGIDRSHETQSVEIQ